ncbi:LysM peptidoglycan-binding domain-containing protein [Streptomyces sp. NBC_00569]|uniref:LysM peptidoglycan-binding domain-containing protein n=1 Tax=Streptomyces sp. NBC_00569 TaxID=2975780 RepID=UPI002E816464|nr:LysM peptidoglycan-binding domain-containing protein [Streptomyces sp. NBC_00569]WUB92469.1 LysM peptidoglycan-binding domain-containing protein [Streptomyces sp. NBC_00569]
MAHRTPAPLRGFGVLARALLGLIALVGLTAGVPYLLIRVGRLPASLPGSLGALAQPDDGTLFLAVLTGIGWLAWAAFTFSVLVEVVALAQRRSAPRIRGLGGLQSLASLLVGGIVLLVPTAASAATSGPAVAATAVHTAGENSGGATPSAQTHAPPAQTTGRQHTVATSTELPWDLAEEYLGDGKRWKDIAALNDIPQLTAGDQYLPKGVTIVLPPDAHARSQATRASSEKLQSPAAPPQQPTGAQHHDEEEVEAEGDLQAQSAGAERTAQVRVVARGDSLSGIAQQETGNGANWPELYEASRGAQPHGLPRITDPDLIRPGQRITIPAPTTPHDDQDSAAGQHNDEGQASDARTQQPPRTGGGSDHGEQDSADESDRGGDSGASGVTKPPTSRPSPHRSEPPASASARPEESARPSAPVTASPSASTSDQERAPAAPQGADDTQTSSLVSTRTAMGAFALLASALTGTLAFRRLRQRRSRKPGQTLPEIVPAAAEAELEQAAHDGADGVERLQAALAALALHGQGTPPLLRAARITADGIEVLPDDVSAAPQAPFTTAHAGWWHLPDDVDLPVPDDEAELPYPALVTLGTDTANSLVLANLPAWEVVLVDGDPIARAETIACMATELALGPHADHVEVVASGLGSMGAELQAFGVQYLPDVPQAAGAFAARILEAHQDPEDRGIPYVMLCGGDLDADTAWQIAETLDHSRGLTPCVLVLPASAASLFPDAEILNASADAPQDVSAIGIDVLLQRLDAASITQLAAAYRQTSRPAQGPEGVWKHVPPEPIEVPESAPAVHPVPDPRQDNNDRSGPVPAGDAAGQHQDVATRRDNTDAAQAQPVAFQALLDSAGDPGQASLKAVPPAPTSVSGEPAERIGPRFLIPPVHSLTAAERTPPILKTDADKTLAGAGPDDTAPRLRVLGTLELHNAGDLEPRLIGLAAHLLLKPHSSAERLCEDLGDGEPWSPKTLGSRLRDLRTRLGADVDGDLYVPQRKGKSSPYALSDKVRCDWHDFERLAKLGVSRGEDGLHYLERALAMVDGAPLGEHAASWMSGLRTAMQARIVDTAHHVASYRTQDGRHQDFPSARQACTTGLNADGHSETLYRALMRAEAAAGNRTGLRAAIAQWQDANRHLTRDQIDKKTQTLVDKLLAAS